MTAQKTHILTGIDMDADNCVLNIHLVTPEPGIRCSENQDSSFDYLLTDVIKQHNRRIVDLECCEFTTGEYCLHIESGPFTKYILVMLSESLWPYMESFVQTGYKPFDAVLRYGNGYKYPEVVEFIY